MNKQSIILCLSGIMVGLLLGLSSKARMAAAMAGSTEAPLNGASSERYSRLFEKTDPELGFLEDDSGLFDEESVEEEAP